MVPGRREEVQCFTGSFLTSFTDVQFELPALGPVTRDAPDFEGADLRDACFQPYRQDGALVPVQLQRYLQWAQLFNLITPILQQVANLILLPHRGAQKAKLGRLTNYQPELPVRNFRLRPLFHAKRNHTQGLERRFHSGHCRHCTLNTYVISARRAAADPYAPPASCPAVVGCAARYGVLQVWRIQNLLRP